MSKELHEDMLWQQIEQEVTTEHEEGLLEEEIFTYSRIGLDADDDRDEDGSRVDIGVFSYYKGDDYLGKIEWSYIDDINEQDYE